MKTFNIKKAPRKMRIRGYDFLGTHPDYTSFAYYISKVDNFNYNFAEVNYTVKLGKVFKLPILGQFAFPKLVMNAGTTIKTIDVFMLRYLDQVIKGEFLTNELFVKETLDELKFDDTTKSYFVDKMPKSIDKNTEIKNAIDKGFKVLYLINTQIGTRRFGKVVVMLVKDAEKSTVFKILEFYTKPSFAKGEQNKEEYSLDINTTINIPHSLLLK